MHRPNITKQQVAVGSTFTIITIILIWRAFQGFDWTDESYYAASAFSIAKGDAMFKAIWSSTQLGAMLYTPIVAFFMTLTGGTEGIILFMRLAYVVVDMAIAIIFYLCVKHFAGRFWGALACIPVFTCIIPATFSYNSVHLLSFFLACALLLRASEVDCTEKRALCLIVSGIACGTGFICYPTTLLSLPLFCIWIAVEPSLGRGAKRKAQNIAFFAVGCAICLIALAIFLSANSSLNAVIANWDHLRSPSSNTHSETVYFLSVLPVMGYGLVAVFAFACIFAAASGKVSSVKTANVLKWLAIAGAGAILAFQCAGALYKVSASAVQFKVFLAMTSVGPILFFLNKCKWHRSIWIFFVGIAISMAVSRGTSNSASWYIYPCAISASGVLLYCSTMARELFGKAGWRAIAGVSIATLLVASLCFLTYVYRDGRIPELTTKLDGGPADGLYTTPERAKQYYDTIDAIDQYMPKGGNVLFIQLLPFGYLSADARPAGPTPWAITYDYPYFQDYYDENPDKLPEAIYFPRAEYAQRNGENTIGSFFEKYLEEHEHTIIEADAATIILIENDDNV